jgi:hypothetical protein
MLCVIMLCVIMLCVIMLCVIMLSVVMLCVIMLSVIMQCVIMLFVIAPSDGSKLVLSFSKVDLRDFSKKTFLRN